MAGSCLYGIGTNSVHGMEKRPAGSDNVRRLTSCRTQTESPGRPQAVYCKYLVVHHLSPFIAISQCRRQDCSSIQGTGKRGGQESGTGGTGKRDRYDIDKMGSFGLWFGDATNSAGRSWWNGFSRLESRRGANAVVREATDYQAFEQVLQDTLDQSPMRICAYAVMPNLWHLLLWPECDGELAAFMQRLTITLCVAGKNTGAMRDLGHVYQGRYKSFPVESDEHFWVVARYVERNALAPISSCERRNGGGQACGNAVILREQSGRCWRRGRSICQRIGSSGSIKPTTRRNWKRCAAACNEAAPLASRNGSRKSRNVWA